jgi:transcriptional regulator with XRE-family HTH domain
MPTQKLENYLRMYRKRSGLTQQDMAYLLGFEDKSQVSRYEKRKRVPPLGMALACEAALGIPVGVLFAGIREAAGKQIRRRFLALRSRLEKRNASGHTKSEARQTARKIEWLASRLGPETKVENAKT